MNATKTLKLPLQLSGMGFLMDADRKLPANQGINGEEAKELMHYANNHQSLIDALEAFVKACDSAPPMELIAKISDACDKARAALAKAKGT